jgi:WD40 repeat protein
MYPRRVAILILAGLLLVGKVAADEPRTDLYGDPLPDGAVARLGSIRLRHLGMSSDLGVLPDGKTVVTAGNDRVLRFWDLATGRQARAVPLQGTAGPGNLVSLSPDGTTLTAEDKGKLIFWEVASGKEITSFPAPRAGLSYLFFSPDARLLAVGQSDKRVSLWEWESGTERPLPLPIRKIGIDSTFHCCFSPDGKWFVAGGGFGEVLSVFDLATDTEVHQLRCNASTSAISPDSKRLAVCSMKNDEGEQVVTLRFFDLASGREEAKFSLGHYKLFHSLAFSPDGKTLACGFSDRSCLVDCATGRVLHRFPDRPLYFTFTPNGKTLLASSGSRLHIWDVASGKELHDRPGKFGYDPALAVHPDGRLLAAGDWMEQAVSVWDTTSGRRVGLLPLKGQQRYVRNLAFSADGKVLVACQGMGFLQFWDVATLKEQRTLQLHDPASQRPPEEAYYYHLRVSPDTRQVTALERVLAQRELTRLALWDTATGKLLRQQALPGELRRCAWAEGGTAVLLPFQEGLTLVEVRTGVLRYCLPDAAPGSPLAASPDGRLLAARRAADVCLWETATGEEVASVPVDRADHLAITPDNRFLVGADDRFLRVWDLAAGKETRRWPLTEAGAAPGGQRFVSGMLLSPDGRRAFTSLADGTALVWDLTPALRPAESPVSDPTPKQLAAWWADLANADARRASAAVWRLAAAPEGAVAAFLRQHLKPAVDPQFEKAQGFIKDLASDVDAVRARAQLEALGSGAASALREALEKDPPAEVRRHLEDLLALPANRVPPPETLRQVRAVQVLERLGSKEARRLLTELTAGASRAADTQEARWALERLSR